MEESNYRSVNGRKAAGVPKVFSSEEIELRKARLDAARVKAVAAIRKKSRDRKERLEAHQRYVKTMAEFGMFVPVQDFE